jgi:DMSO/TMAO reductase YedYZ molybdopterin-dependent catalytic subunit
MPADLKMDRRRFVQLLLGGTAAALLQGCGVGPGQTSAPQAPAPGASQAPARPAPSATRALLQNENRPGFYVRYYRPFPAVDPDEWTLTVDGLVRTPLALSMRDVQTLPSVSQVSRMKCVECWSAPAKWEGFHLSSLLERAEPTAQARWVHLHCADGYIESDSIDTLLRDRVVLAYRMNDEVLPDAYGAPLRLMIPFLYGYKSAKAIVRIELAEEELPGTWPTLGPYTTEGIIQPGRDHPLDLGGSRPIAGRGEIVYPDGIESAGE